MKGEKGDTTMDLLNILLIYIICVIGFITIYLIYGAIVSHQISNILNIDCDPERYLMKINKRDKRRNRNLLHQNIMEINRSAAYMTLGDYEEADKHLKLVEEARIVKYHIIYATYMINRLGCHYERGEIEEAERLYEMDLVLLRLLNQSIYKSIEILIGERYFYLGHYDKSYEQLKKLLNRDLNKRQYLEVLFLLAKMDLMRGEIESASKKLEKIVRLGNKLGIVKEAQEMIASM